MKRLGCSGCAWIFLLLFVALFIAPFTFELLKEKWEIHQLLVHAKSIRIEQYRSWIDTMAFGGTDKDEVIASKELAPEKFYKVGGAFPIAPDVGIPGIEVGCSFNPHHRIIITDAEGNVTTIRVCFECDHIGISHRDQKYDDIKGTPFVWMWSLRHFFAEEGMPDAPELYRKRPSAESTNAAPAINAPTNAAR